MLLDARASFLNTFVLKAGDTMTGALVISAGGLTVDGAAVFNEASADVDFRVESNDDANMFVVDAGNNRVGIRDSTPSATLHVDQKGAGAAIPVLVLDQADIDVEFIRLVGSSEDGQADRSLVDVADMTTPGALVGWWQIYVEDVQGTNPIPDGVYYSPLYAAPSS